MPGFPPFPIMILDDEAQSRLGSAVALRSAGIDNIFECADSASAMDMIKERKPGVLLLDLIMPGRHGVDILAELAKERPETSVIVVSGQNEISAAVACMKHGAFDYIPKPVDKDTLVASVRRAIEMVELRKENSLMREQLLAVAPGRATAFSPVIAASPAMEALFKYCSAIGPGRQPVLITGETGTGKELFAKALHSLGGRGGKFVAVNLAGLDSNIFSDTLFGHVKGAFTGAGAIRKGLVEEASGGTLFLDEIGDLPEDAQIKLLRLLQEREYSPLGSDGTKTSDARVVVATHRDLAAAVESGSFRRDILFRLKIHHVHLPPLRERPCDIGPIFRHFVEEAAAEFKKSPPEIAPALVAALESHPLPGNARELKAIAYEAVGRCNGGTLSCEDLPKGFAATVTPLEAPAPQRPQTGSIVFPGRLPHLKEVSMMLIEEALRRTDGRQGAAAKLLGVTQQALSKRLKGVRR